jgi:hypothetical protein
MKRMCEYNTEELCECGKAMSKTINAPTITGMNSLGQSGGIIDKGGKIQ